MTELEKRSLLRLPLNDDGTLRDPGATAIVLVCSAPQKGLGQKPVKHPEFIGQASWAPDGRGFILHEMEGFSRTKAARARGLTLGETLTHKCSKCGRHYRISAARIFQKLQESGSPGHVLTVDLFTDPLESQ